MPSFPAIDLVEARRPQLHEMRAHTMDGSTTEQFHDQAEVCRSLATKAPKAMDKAFWLRLSDYWLELGDGAKRSAPDRAPS